MDKFDVTFAGTGVSIGYHFCREEDCHGTNDTHGYSFDEAKKVVVHYLERELGIWRGLSPERWRRNYHPTEKEMNEDMSVAEDLYALGEESRTAQSLLISNLARYEQ